MMYRGYVVEVVSTFKVYKIVTLVKLILSLNLYHQLLCTELKLLFLCIFK